MTGTNILAKKFFTIHLDSLSTTLTANDLKVYHKGLQKHVGDTPILFIVDTFRSAFLAEAEIGSSNDDSAMVKLSQAHSGVGNHKRQLRAAGSSQYQVG